MGKRVSEIESGAGYFQGLITGLMEVVREKTIPFGAIYRLVTPEGRKTLQKMVDLSHADWLEEQPKGVESRKWREVDGVIYFSVTSDGTTGEDWITRLESKGFRVSDYAKQVLRSQNFKPTNCVTTEVAVLKGVLFLDNDRITKNIRAEADKRKLSKPNAELACLIREKFTDKEIEAMDLLWIVTMHEPINDSDGDPNLLNADRDDDGRWLSAYNDGPDDRWHRGNGFAFAVSSSSAEATADKQVSS